jgi:periplasmic protein TonB
LNAMSWVRSIAFFLSAAVHAALLLLLASRSEFSEDGKGRDSFTVVIPITVVNGDLPGLNERNERANQAVTPATPSNTERLEPEKRSTALPAGVETTPLASKRVSSDESLGQAALDTKPVKQIERAAEDESSQSPVAPQTPPQAPAETEQEQASQALEARRKQLSSLYHREIFMALRRHRVDPHSGRAGRVVILAIIASSGGLVTRTIMESSGSDVLDRAALATFDKSAPFPAIPRELGSDSITLRVPFEYSMR